MVLKYNYIPESELNKKEERKWVPLEDGMCQLEVRNIIELDENREKIEFWATDQKGNKGIKSDIFTPNTLWKVVALLKALGRMDLYSQKGETDFSKTLGLKCFGTLKTKFYPDKNKEYQNIDSYIERNDFHDEPSANKNFDVRNDVIKKQAWNENDWNNNVDEDDIPF